MANPRCFLFKSAVKETRGSEKIPSGFSRDTVPSFGYAEV